MPNADSTGVIVTGVAAFVGAAVAVILKYWADHKLMERENLRQKTESLARHLRSLATLAPMVQSTRFAPDDKYGRQSFLEHLQDARAECCGIEMYGTSRIRTRSEEVRRLLQDAEWSAVEELDEAAATRLADHAAKQADLAIVDWRSGEGRRYRAV